MILQFRTLMLPVAMLLGYLFSGFFSSLGAVTPYLIFSMLFISFCKVSPREMKLSRLHLWLILIQLCVSLGMFFILFPFTEIAAQSALVCIFAPTATSAIVIGGMLGANVASMATFTLLSNIVVALSAPVIFSFIGTHSDMPFTESFMMVFLKVMPVLILPFASAVVLNLVWPGAVKAIKKVQILSFYFWSLALTIVTGQTVKFLDLGVKTDYTMEIYLGVVALFLCIGQFAIGRGIGRLYGETITGGQSLGQKNTVLAIWMAQSYLDPVTSIGPAAYVLWQNLVNGWQLWHKQKLDERTKQH